MPSFTESNITLTFPDSNFFRFADCDGYKTLSGHHFKEMDFCWHETVTGFYWLIELKDYSSAALSAQGTIEKKVWDIVKKAVDSLTMFIASKHGYPYATTNLDPCFPIAPAVAGEFKFVTIVHCDPSQKPDVQLMHNSFRQKFKPYAQLFGIKHYAIMEHSQAILKLPTNIVT
ncbi:MAG: hypothetical protein ACK4Q5_18590 [Saprospiraceae bacterium]